MPERINTPATSSQVEITPYDIVTAEFEDIFHALDNSQAFVNDMMAQPQSTATSEHWANLETQIEAARDLSIGWTENNDRRAQEGRPPEGFGAFIARAKDEFKSHGREIPKRFDDADSFVRGENSDIYKSMVSNVLLEKHTEPMNLEVANSADIQTKQSQSYAANQQEATEKQQAVVGAREAVEQARGTEVLDDVTTFAKGKTRIYTADTRGNFADIGDSPIKDTPEMPTRMRMQEMNSNNWRDNLNEAVMFFDVIEPSLHDVVKTRQVKGRFGKTHTEEYTVSEEVPGGEHPKLIHNEQTSQDEPMVQFVYQFKYSDSASSAMSSGELPKTTSRDARSGNNVRIGIDLPKSLADKLIVQIQQDPASLRLFVDKLILGNNNGGMTAERYEGKDGYNPSRMPYDKLPKDWTIGLVRGTTKKDYEDYQVTRMSAYQ